MVSLRCHGEYSYIIVDPILFYTNICGNVSGRYVRSSIDSQLKSELMTKLQPALNKLSEMDIPYFNIPGHVDELADALNEALSKKWAKEYGIKIESFGVSSVRASDEDEQKISDYMRYASMGNPMMAGLQTAGATADATKIAAANEGGMGAMGAFMGMGMAGNTGGVNAANMMQMGMNMQQQQPQSVQPKAEAPANSWNCSCGTVNTGKFCVNCGTKKPVEGWTCSCGSVNKGKFCPECGNKKPEGTPLYKCDKCGWKPEDPYNPPKFCPECGDSFDENDIVK